MIRRRTVAVAAALAVALLVVTASPATAAQNLSHSTFGTGAGEPSPTATSGFAVFGTGSSAAVEATGASSPYSLSYLGNAPDVRVPVESSTVTVDVKNPGRADSSAGVDVDLAVDGAVVAQKSAFLSPGESTTMSFSVDQSIDSGVSTSFSDPDQHIAQIQGGQISWSESTTLSGASYTGAAFSAGGAAETAEINITVTDATVEATWQSDADGDGTWTDIVTTSYTSSGQKTTDLSGAASDRVRLRLDVTNAGSTGYVALRDVQVLSGVSPPSATNPTPSGETSSYGGSVSLDVDDPDFGTAAGDELTVTASAGGSQIGSTTISSAGTASFSYGAVAGENTITWTVTDSYGRTETVTQTFRTPAELEIRNETGSQSLITTSGDISITYFAGDQVIERDISGGTANLSGLPADERLIAVVEADGYYGRRVVIPSLFEQQTVYLLNESETANEIQFQIEDQTLTYTSESILYVEKPITTNGTTEYRVLVADEFGVGGLTTRLVPDARYRLRIVNQDGQEVVLGSYTADVAEVVTLRPEPGRIGITDDEEDLGYSASLSNQTLVVDYYDPTNTSDVTLAIVERGNHSNTLEPNQTYDGLGRLTYQTNLTADESNRSWVVLIEGTRQSSETVDVRIPVDRGENLVPSDLSFAWRFGLVTLVLVLSAALWGQFSVGLGATITGVVGGLLWWFGFLDGIASGAAVAIAIGIGAMVRLYEGGGR